MPPVEVFYSKQNVALSRPNREPIRVVDEDEARYTLSGYGSIAVSNSLFVPSAPTPISPRKKQRKVDDDGFITPPQRVSKHSDHHVFSDTDLRGRSTYAVRRLQAASPQASLQRRQLSLLRCRIIRPLLPD
jgi:hypothetical protein